MPILAFPRAGTDIMGRQQQLYQETPVRVTGAVSNAAKASLERNLKTAAASQKYALEQRGLYVRSHQTEYLTAKPISPNDGFTGAYTNGDMMVVNSYAIPESRYYAKLKGWMNGIGGRFGRYMADKFGSKEKANESLRYTIAHEEGLILTQLREMETDDGKVISPFIKRLYDGLKNYYAQRLKKNDQWLSDLLAYLSFRPLAEGANEVFAENVANGRTAEDIIKLRGRQPDTYSDYAVGSAKFCLDHDLDPGEEAAHFYSRPDLLNDYIKEHPARFKIPTSYLRTAA